MYIRRDTKKVEIKGARKGRGRLTEKETTYLSIAHNVVEDSPKGKRTKPVVFANLGPEENISGEMARSLAGAFERYAAKRLGEKPTKAEVAKVALETRATSPVVRLLASKELGMRLLLSAPWKALGIGPALSAYAKKHRCEFPIERVVFAMVLNRLVDPKSKRACNDWVADRGYVPEAVGWQVQHFYRTLDILHEHWEELEDLLASHLDALLSDEERRLQLVDTTTLFFEAEMTDREIALLNEKWDDFEKDGTLKAPRRPRREQLNETEFRMRGHNKDGHPECPQVKIALVCAPGGQILRHEVYAGNKADSTITMDLVENKLDKPTAGTVRVWVGDAGMMGADQIAALDGAGWERVSAEPLRKSKLGKKLFKAQGGQYRKDPNRPHMRYKVENISATDSPSGKPETWVFTRNERERERQLEAIERHLDKVAEELARKPGEHMAHAKSVCGVASHISLKKYIKPSENVPGSYVMDQEAIAWERRLAGVRCYRTTLLALDGPAILAMYNMLQDVEARNKALKHPLALRPCYHRVERRIRAHVMLNVLAANCALYMEKRTGLTLDRLRTIAAGVTATEVEQGSKRYWQRSETNRDFETALAALDVKLPPIIWSEWIEPGKQAKKVRASAS